MPSCCNCVNELKWSGKLQYTWLYKDCACFNRLLVSLNQSNLVVINNLRLSNLCLTAPVYSLSLTADNSSSYTDYSRDMSPGIPVLTLTEKQSVNVQCQAMGGYPPPSLEVFLNSADVSSEFSFSHSADLTGDKGLRTIVYDTRRISHTFTAMAEDDGKKLRCIAAVPGLKSNITFVTLNVLCKCRGSQMQIVCLCTL